MDSSSLENTYRNITKEAWARYKEAYQDALSNLEEFWSKRAENLVWYKKWDKVLDDSNKPFYRWYVGGMLNACYNTVDVHVEQKRGDCVAIKYDSPVINEIRYITFNQLREQVSKLAGALLKLGVQMGDRVMIYMPTIPESVIAMLACARIGAIHVQVYGGFSAAVLAQRMQHTEPKVLITATYGLESTAVVFYQPKVEEALKASAHQPQKCIVYIRPGQQHQPLKTGHDVSWKEAVDSAMPCDCISVEATHPLFILHTSGTTGTPKAVIVDTGGFLVKAGRYPQRQGNYVKAGETTMWFFSNFGWMSGHIAVYSVLCAGSATVLYEGKAVGTPDASAFYRVISQHRVNFMFSSPANFRAIRKEDPEGQYRKKYKDWCLKSMLTGGEPVSRDIQLWVQKHFSPLAIHVIIGQTECSVTSWPHEVGFPFQQPPGNCGVPCIGADVHILRPDGTDCSIGEIGNIALRLPLMPGSTNTLYKNDEMFKELYLKKYPGFYDTKDLAYIDEHGLLVSVGRADDIIKVSGHRLETTHIELMVESHPDVVESAVVGKPDEERFQIPLALYVRMSNDESNSSLVNEEIIQKVTKQLGPSGVFFKAVEVPVLPKNVNGKILRNAIAALITKGFAQIPPTAECAEDFELLRQCLQEKGLLPTGSQHPSTVS